MSYYGKGFATFGKFASKKVKKTKGTPIPKKRPEKKKKFKELSEREIFAH